MPRIWCSISGHGFGHGAQTIPILNELGRRLPDLHVMLRTNLSQHFLQKNLTIPWELHPSIQDIGCVQNGPLFIDVPTTWMEYEKFHIDWFQKIRAEAELIRSHQPDLVVSNISYLGIEAGAQSGIPTVAMGSLSWDRALEYLGTQVSDEHERIIEQIRRSYRKANLMIRFGPNIPMVAFREIVDVGPIAAPPLQSTGSVRDLLKMDPKEKLILVAFGGIPLSSFPVDRLKGFEGYRFLVDGSMALQESSHVNSINVLPFPFRQILAEADLIMTKPGYATVIEAVRNAIPLVYVRRYNFVDEQILVDYAHRYGRARELHIDQFNKGEWLQALETVQRIPLPIEAPPELGTQAAAEILAKFLSTE
jgi:hypothetical protein